MIFDTSTELDQKRAVERFKFLLDNKKTFEIKEKKPRRSISQNAYEHLLFSFFAIEYGETAEYVKQEIFKKIVNPDIFKTARVNPKTGQIREHWRSTAELDTKENTTAIDRFRDYSSKEAGIYLPEPSDMALINQIENELSKNNSKQYL